jgi:hypothetical protein
MSPRLTPYAAGRMQAQWLGAGVSCGCELTALCERCLRLGGGKAIRSAAKIPNIGVWLSLVEHLVRDEGVAGSNPATPTINPPNNQVLHNGDQNGSVLSGPLSGTFTASAGSRAVVGIARGAACRTYHGGCEREALVLDAVGEVRRVLGQAFQLGIFARWGQVEDRIERVRAIAHPIPRSAKRCLGPFARRKRRVGALR